MKPYSKRGSVLIYIAAAIFMLFAIAYLVAPTAMVALIGISLTTSGETDIRATYGGLQAGIALFLFWTAMSNVRISTGLVALLLICSSVAVFRGVGILVSGELGLHYVGFLFEVPLACLAAITLRGRMREESST